MASGSTNNFCARINSQLKKEDGLENELAIYCKENGNITLLDPSGAIPNNSVDQEDLIIYATLVARVRNKSLVEQKEPETLTTINFVKGQDTAPGQAPVGTSFLTTNWTDLGGIDSQLGEDLETFGMTNIDINFNGGFVPIITIDFVDIRGATLFEQGSCSPYGAFFHQPYPIFELTVKGYYGQPVKYFLSVQKFTTSFDPGTGNYKSRAQFIGYSYAFLSDILLGFVMAAPYIEGADTKLNKIYQDYLKYYKTLGYNEGINSFNPIKSGNEGRPLTVFNYVKKLQGLMGQGNSDQGAIAEIQNSTEINNVSKITAISVLISQIREILEDFEEEWVRLGGKFDNGVYTFGQPSATGQDPNGNLVGKVRELISEYLEGEGKIPFRINIFNEQITQISGLGEIGEMQNNYTTESDDENLFIIDLNPITKQLNDKNVLIQKALNESRQTFKRLANQKIKNSIGFVPTVRSFFTVLIANSELFLEILKDVSYEAEEYHNTNTTEVFNYKGKADVQVGGAEGVFWAWPTYTEKKLTSGGSSSFVEVYPGNNPKFANWPEVRFVEEFLKALQQMMKDVEQEIEEPTGEGDVYNNVPGRDNYVPINGMEVPIGVEDCSNNYYGLTTIESAFKAVGERFIIASNVTGINSNNLNTSIIATAKNKFYDWRRDQYPSVNKLNASHSGLGTFHGLEYLNSGLITPFSSAGIPFNPTKFGGKDDSLTKGLTYTGNYKKISNLEGYPYVDWGTVSKRKGTNPFGTAKSWFQIEQTFKEDNMSAKSYPTLASVVGGNKFEKLNRVPVSDDNTLEPEDNALSRASSNVAYYSSVDKEILVGSSPLNQKIEYDGTRNINNTQNVFLISTPKFYTKTLIIVYADREDIIPRDTQFKQIPSQVVDKCFIVVKEKDEQRNVKSGIIDELKAYYKSSMDIKINSNGTPLDMDTELNGFKVIEIGFGAGAVNMFTQNGLNSADLIGLADPGLKTEKLRDLNRWNSKTRMLWGSDGFIGVYQEKNYKTLDSTIKSTNGKSTLVKGLNHSTALSQWFTTYASDVDNIISTGYQTGFTDRITITSPPVPPPSPSNTSNSKTNNFGFNNEQDASEVKKILKGLKDGTYKKDKPLQFGTKAIPNRSALNWKTLGRIEAHNFFNSTENLTLIGQMINASKDDETGEELVSIVYDKIIKSLGITEEDTFIDKVNESYRYDQPLVISKAAKKDGGPVTVLPDIHEMQGDDLIRLKRYDFTKFLNQTVSAKNPPSLNGLVRGAGGAISPATPFPRTKFGLSKENTILTSSDVEDWVNEYYGPAWAAGNNNKNLVSEQSEGRGSRLVDLKPSSNGLSLRGFNESYKKSMVLNTGLLYTPNSFIVQLNPTQIDGSASAIGEKGTPFLSSFTQMSFSVTDKFLTVDIYPDFEFYYKAFERVGSSFARSEFGDKLTTGDFNLRTAKSIHEFNNLNNITLRAGGASDSQASPNVAPFRSWHTFDWAYIPTTKEYSYKKVNIEGISKFQSKTLTWVRNNQIRAKSNSEVRNGPVPYLPYSTSYSSYNNTPTKLVEELTNQGLFEDISAAATSLFAGLSAIRGVEPPPSNDVTQDDSFNLEDVTDYRLLNWNPDNPGVFGGFSVQNSQGVPPGQLEQPTTLLDELNDATLRKNENYQNVGGTIVESPFWRHNFPASENGSNVPKAYYSFAGGMVMNVADTTDHENAGVASKPLYMAFKNDLDTYNETSKYFPGGFGVKKFTNGSSPLKPFDYYNHTVNSDGERTGIKLTLTNHNFLKASLERPDLKTGDSILDLDTNYNKTKAWKGALAYLFLANQYHKPWTGMYSSSLKNLGPQGILGSAALNQSVPVHSVYLLGAVLWRMREADLLRSEDPKWDMKPKITDGTDPVNYPKLPRLLQFGKFIHDTENFLSTEDSKKVNTLPPPGSRNYVTNQGVRPPQLSIATKFNLIGRGKDSDYNLDSSILTFPRADEWPAPNKGALYAYDFFGDKKVKNPFYNQYKIFTQVLSKGNQSLLNYLNQAQVWSTTSIEAQEFQEAVIAEFEDNVSDLKDYSDSAKASIQNELGAYAQSHIENQLKAFSDGTIPPGLEAYLSAFENFAGVEEGFTKFTAIAHTLSSSFKGSIRLDVEKYGLKSLDEQRKKFLDDNVNKEDGRYRLVSSDTTTRASDTESLRVWDVDPQSINPNAGTPRTGGTVVGVDGNTSKSFDGLFDGGLSQLDDEYIKKYGKVIEVKTFDELKKIFISNRYTDPTTGEDIPIRGIYGEVPNPEKVKTFNVANDATIYPYINKYGKPRTQNSTRNSSAYNNYIIPERIEQREGGRDGKPFSFKVLYGQINFHPNALEQDRTSQDLANITIPQVNELNGGYNLTYLSGLKRDLTGSNSQGRTDYSSDIGAIQATNNFNIETYQQVNPTDGPQIIKAYKGPEAQKSINETWNLGLTAAQTRNNLYSFYGFYRRGSNKIYSTNFWSPEPDRNDAEDIVYQIDSAKLGRKFIVIPLEVPPLTPAPSILNNFVTPLNETEERLTEVFKNVGQLRGYIPLGPEIWFMPTAVKEKFISEFENYVGDFNNFLGDSDFDGALEYIDPINFPTPEKTNGFPNVFKDELTYPTIFEEFGTVGCSAPTILKPTTDDDKSKFREIEVDKRGLPLIPKPLAKWLNFYNYSTGIKPVTSSGGNGFTNVSFREMKTPLPLKLTDPAALIYGSLFNSVYTISYPTPRIWWGEFPLKEENGELVETTNKYFRFNKQEFFEFTSGFMSELLGSSIFPVYKDKLKENYLDSLSAEALGANQDDDLRLTVYKSLKNIYDRWISASPAGKTSGQRRLFFNPIGEDRLLIDHFSFVDRVNQDVGDRALINLETVNSLFYNTRNSIYGVTSDVLDGSNFNFFPLPSYVDLSAGTSLFSKTNTQNNPSIRQNALKDMFRPLSSQEYFNTTLANSSGPHFLCQYVGGNSSELELSNNKEKGCLDDQTVRKGKKQYKGTSFSQDPDKNEAPPDFSEKNENSNGVIGFKVKFGSETQSHFLGVNLDQAEYKNTLEALNAIDKIANSGTDGGSGGFVAKGQSLYEVFLNRSYNCTVEALGNAMIQPLQYFELENVPMFYGSYLIMDVKHNIRPHSMKTTFTGNRVPYATVPIVEDIISSFNLKPSQNGSLTSLSTGTGTSSATSPSGNLGSASQQVLDTSGGLYIKGGSKNHLFIGNVSNGLAGTYLRGLMKDYNSFVQTNYPGKNWQFSSNGVTRSLEDTVKGGANRSKTSLHGAGLAIDVQFLGTYKQSDGSTVTMGNAYDKKGSFPGERRYGYSAGNYTAVQDVEFVESIYKFMTTVEPYKTEITWGGTFYGWCSKAKKCKNIPSVPIRQLANRSDYPNFNIAVNEMHHFEIKSQFIKGYWEPYKEVLEKFQLPYPPKNGKERQKIYEYPFENPSALDNDVPSTPQGDAVAGNTNIDPNLQKELNGPSTQAVNYGITDYQLFTYLAWQQGAGGAAQHYSLWKRNGKKSKYSIPVKNIKANWPGSYVAKNGVKKDEIDNLYNTNQSKLAEGFVDVQRQLYSKKLATGLNLINSNGKNRSGVPYSTIKQAFEKHQSPPEVDFNNLVAFGTIENGLQTDTKKGKTFITMFQMNSKSGSYDSVLNKLTRKKSIYRDDFEDFENIDVLTASAVPKMISNFETFKRVSGFV